MNHALSIVTIILASLGARAYAVDCQNNLSASNLDASYEDHGNGTVTDIRSGLMWKRCSEGQSWDGITCNGSATGHTWVQALTLAEGSSFAGHADWRLANIKELRALVEECRVGPAINNTVFPNTPNAYFWSSSPAAFSSSDAWYVDFGNGYVSWALVRSSEACVRLVRNG